MISVGTFTCTVAKTQFRAISFGLLLILSAGCERLPSTSFEHTSGKFQADTVDPTWVEKTSWRAQSGGFEIRQPPLFDLGQQPRLKSLPVGEPNSIAGIADYEKPSWMDDDIYLAFRSYLEPPSPFVPTFTKNLDGKSVKAIVLNRDGSRLMLVQDSITILDINGKETKEVFFTNPLTNCLDASFDPLSKHAILFGDSRLVKISLDDAKIVQQKDFPTNEGRLVCFAANSDLIGVATEHGDLKVLDEQWKESPSLAFDAKAFRVTANRKSIAMDASGQSIVAATTKGMSAWRLDSQTNAIRQDTRLSLMMTQEEAAKSQDVAFCSDNKFYAIVGDFFASGTIERIASSGVATLAFASRQSLSQPSRMVPELVDAIHCQTETASWIVFFRQVQGKDGNRLLVHDIFDSEATSKHTAMKLDATQPMLIAMSLDGTKIAVVSKDKLQIWTRKLTDPTGIFLARSFGKLFEQKRIEQIDKCFAELQRLNVVRGMQTRDELNQMIASELKQTYQMAMTGRTMPSELQRFLVGQSDLSIDLRRQLFQSILPTIGGTQNGEHFVTAESVKRSLQDGEPAIAQFRMFLRETPCTYENIPKVKELLQQYIELFPDRDDYHIEMIEWIQRIGNATTERYVEDVCALAPEGLEAVRMLRIAGKLSSRNAGTATQFMNMGNAKVDRRVIAEPLDQFALLAAIRHVRMTKDGESLELLKQRYADEHPLAPIELNWQTLKVDPLNFVPR